MNLEDHLIGIGTGAAWLALHLSLSCHGFTVIPKVDMMWVTAGLWIYMFRYWRPV